MSSKKKDKNDWTYCEYCFCYIPRVCTSRHSKDSSSQCDLSLQNGFIKNGIFHGIAKSYSDETDGQLPSSRIDYILINPVTLKACNLSVACSIVVFFNGIELNGTLWPSTSVSLDQICLMPSKFQSLHASDGSLISIRKIKSPSIVADSITFSSNIEFNDKTLNEVTLSLCSLLDKTILRKGEIVPFHHHGTCVDLTITEINNDTTTGDDISNVLSKINLNVLDGIPDSIPHLFMSSHTTMNIKSSVEDTRQDIPIIPLQVTNIGGLRRQISILNDLVKLPFVNRQLYLQCGVDVPRGILLFGPPGTGKTTLIQSYVSSLKGLNLVTINGPELTSKFFGETEQKLREIFRKAITESPSVLVVDEFDAVCPKRTSSSNESEKRVVATFCTLLDEIPNDSQFLVVGVTNKVEEIDPALRRPGRFEKEVEFNVPNQYERFEILSKLISNLKQNITEMEIDELSAVTHGYVGADLSALCKEAGGLAVREFIKKQPKCQENKDIKNLTVTIKHFKQAMRVVSPSALKALTIDIPKVHWDDVGGQKDVKQKLIEAIEWPLKHPESFKRLGIKPPRGLLMYGPPGCSKTMMAKALATESSLNFISIKGPELFNKYLGESERAVREVFRKARLSAPCIVFFDEIDALGVQRSGKDKEGGNAGDRVLAQLLTELDGVESLEGVIIVAATNRPDIIDPALIRPGRIDRLIYVPLPDSSSRKEIFEIQFRLMSVEDVSMETLIELTSGYSGAEICSICHEAGLVALRQDINSTVVKGEHFQDAINQINPGTSDDVIKYYDNFAMKRT